MATVFTRVQCGLVMAAALGASCGGEPESSSASALKEAWPGTTAKGAPAVGRNDAATTAAAGPASAGERVDVPIGGSPWRGEADAPVTIVLFSDYQCLFCKRFAASLAEVEVAYSGDLKIVYKHLPLPFHTYARSAALAAEAARAQGKFWEMHEALLADDGGLDDAAITRHAAALGLDLRKLDADRRAPEIAARIEADLALAQRLEARGAPTWFINGHKVTGARPTAQLRSLIEAARDGRRLDDEKVPAAAGADKGGAAGSGAGVGAGSGAGPCAEAEAPGPGCDCDCAKDCGALAQ